MNTTTSHDKHLFIKRTSIPVSAESVFDWHLREGAFERLAPPWERPEVLAREGSIAEGGTVTLSLPMGPFRTRWVAKHRDFQAGHSFVDEQLQGPFRTWRHTHTVSAESSASCVLEDRIEYTPPGGWFGATLLSSHLQQKLNRVFDYRHRITRDDVLSHSSNSKQTMKILISGATGLVGRSLTPYLTTGGHEVYSLTRDPKHRSEHVLYWDPRTGELETDRLEGFDAVIHLAGENIASGRWTAAQKARIRDSRIVGTKLLSEALSRLKQPPKSFLCASAIGYYGPRGDEIVTENSASGSGFLADVCREWEAASQAAVQRGIRVVSMRIGVILSAEGGALAKMLLPFKLGLGGILGSGSQYMSCIALDDVVGAMHHLLSHENVSGPVNLVGPTPVTNREFTKTLGQVLHRPTLFPVPGFAAKAALGEMADELLLASLRVVPQRLLDSGYQFRFPTLEGALRHLLGK